MLLVRELTPHQLLWPNGVANFYVTVPFPSQQIFMMSQLSTFTTNLLWNQLDHTKLMYNKTTFKTSGTEYLFSLNFPIFLTELEM
jgi:hypothetical protein